MALTVAEIAYLDTKLGPGTWDATDLEARIERTGSEVYAAREVLEGRLATFRSQPAQFTIPGEYQQSAQENIRALERALNSMPIPPEPDEGSGGAPARIVRPDTRRWRR